MRNSIKEYTTKVILDTGGQHLSDQMYVWSFMTVYNFEKKTGKLVLSKDMMFDIHKFKTFAIERDICCCGWIPPSK